MEEVRLNKYLSDAGVCSRREADRLIETGRVTVDGEVAVMGMKVLPSQQIIVNGRLVTGEDEAILLAVNKPVGIVCTTSKEEKDNIVDFVGYHKRVYPIGRLDKDSEGLILMTNQGELVNKILRGSRAHEKEYLVKVNKPVTNEFIEGMSAGVPILDTVTKPCFVERTAYNGFRIILTQGLNRQIRRMCEYFGYRVTYLKRVRVMNVKLGNLKSGEYRRIQGAEYQEVMRLLEGSDGKSWAQLHADDAKASDDKGLKAQTNYKGSVKVQSNYKGIAKTQSNYKGSAKTQSNYKGSAKVQSNKTGVNKGGNGATDKADNAKGTAKKINVVFRRENSGLKKDSGN